MRIVRNLCIDTIRRRRSNTHPPIFDDLWKDMSPTPEMQIIAVEDRQALRTAIAELPEKYRTPLLMHYSAKRTRKEIALALGLPESTIIGRLAGAMRILRKRLRDSS
jgi:RNA polymerase sigma-70 factor (ECF subfamily)